MENAIDYFIKVNFVFTLLFSVYYVLFRKQKFLNINRFFLLAIIALSLFLPVLPTANLRFHLTDPAELSTLVNVESQPDGNETLTAGHTSPDAVSQKDSVPVIVGMYMIIVTVLLARFSMQLRTIIMTIKCAKRWKVGSLIYCKPILPSEPFSFFHYIVLPKDEYDQEKYQQIKLHEQAHVRQFHTVDVMLTKVFTIAMWINPLVYLFQKQVKLNLEFLADQATIEKGVNVQNYQLNLIRHHTNATVLQSVNTFFSSKLKQRVVMMNKAQPKVRQVFRYMFIVPIIALASISVGLKPENLSRKEHLPVETQIAVLPTKQEKKNNSEHRLAATKKPVRAKRMATNSQVDKKDIYINATSDTVKIELIPNRSKTAKSYEGIYSIDDKIMSDQEIRAAIRKAGRLEIVMARRPVIGVYGKNDSVAIKKWGKKASNGIIFLETPDIN